MEAQKQSTHESTNTTTNPLDSLVSSGTITHEQEDVINSAFESAMNL